MTIDMYQYSMDSPWVVKHTCLDKKQDAQRYMTYDVQVNVGVGS